MHVHDLIHKKFVTMDRIWPIRLVLRFI